MRRRIDQLLADRGLCPSREQARRAVLAGEVRVDGEVITKAGHLVNEDAEVLVAQKPRFVSRGGTKLEGALEAFGIDVAGLRVIDVGASTGGFTDCVLQRGAAEVTAVDVGYGQLAWGLRSDARVRVFERTNIRCADPAVLGAPFDVAVVDVSFISLRTVFESVSALLGESGQLVALVKPQFEIGKGRVGKKGVVRSESDHVEVLRDVRAAVEQAGWIVRGLTFSPITGPEGNIEFWLWAARHGVAADVEPEDVVRAAHATLGG